MVNVHFLHTAFVMA